MRQEVATDPRCGSYLGLRSVDDGGSKLGQPCEHRRRSAHEERPRWLQEEGSPARAEERRGLRERVAMFF